MIKYVTAGESHGKGLTVIASGFPSNLPVSSVFINEQLKRRQSGYGRGMRMKIESDSAEILSGIRFGKTIGSPITLFVKNTDWQNWTEIMSIEGSGSSIEKITVPRPGHADLVGTLKYNFNDIRNSIDRSSARETAARVAACSIARQFLSEFGIHVGSYVESIGGVYSKNNFLKKFVDDKNSKKFDAQKLNSIADKSSVRVLDEAQESKVINKIKIAKKRGDSLGGTFVVMATGLPVGLGTYMNNDERIDAEIAHAMLSIQAVKGVEVGFAFEQAEMFGSEVHDEIIFDGKEFARKTNHAGGVEGGITTGMPIIVRGAMKPISTLMSPLGSVDLSTLKKVEARRERSDFVAVPACAVIGESMLAWVIAKRFLEKFGSDSLEETKDNYKNYQQQLIKRIKKNFFRK